MGVNRLRVKDLKQLNNKGLIEEYKNFCLSDSTNFNEAFFNSISRNSIYSKLYKQSISYELVTEFISMGYVSSDVFRFIIPKNKKDALKIFIKYPDESYKNIPLLLSIDRDSFKEWFFYAIKNNINSVTIQHVGLAFKTHILDGDGFYNLLDKNSKLYTNYFSYYNRGDGAGYSSKHITNLLNTNIYKGETINSLKSTITNFVETTIKRNKETELNFLLIRLTSLSSDPFYTTLNYNKINNEKDTIDERLLKINLSYKKLFLVKSSDENFEYSHIFRYLSLDEKKKMINSVLDINIEFYKKYFYYSTQNFVKLMEYYLHNSFEDKKEIEYYILNNILNNSELFNLISKDNQYGFIILAILNKDIFDKISNNNDLLKKLFVYNNKIHYIFSRIYPDHELSKLNYNSEACYGNIWQEECSNCLFYLERNLNLITRCSKKYEPIIDLEVKDTKNLSRNAFEIKYGKTVGKLINNN